MYQYDKVVFIGRFQPFHNGHAKVLEAALRLGEEVYILLGSSFKARSIKNPFTEKDRSLMIHKSVSEKDGRRIRLDWTRDYLYNEDLWMKGIQEAVDAKPGEKVGIIGYSKDRSSYYLKKFPQWDLIDVDLVKPLDATTIRNVYFQSPHSELLKSVLPEPVQDYLEDFSKTEFYADLVEEFKFVQAYKESWSKAPYQPTFNTVDGVITCAGHVLMVKRRMAPGKGQWALPGGFVNPGETLLESTIREIKEETSIQLNPAVLLGNIKQSKVFDHPDRSLRGRTITYASHIPLTFNELPLVKGGDDAEKARWISYSELVEIEDQVFEDHLEIINNFTGI